MPAGSFHIAGPDHLAAIPGFATPLPLELSRTPDFAGKPLIYSTTNGTVALRRSKGAAAIYATSLRNASATLAHIEARHAELPLVIVCAGSAGALNLEDFHAAGCLVDRLTRRLDPARDFSDTALAAWAASRATDAWSAPRRVARRTDRLRRRQRRRSAPCRGNRCIAGVAVVSGDQVIRTRDGPPRSRYRSGAAPPQAAIAPGDERRPAA
jgi:phosphosulfolactate phosphohydrolase-like enzyme